MEKPANRTKPGTNIFKYLPKPTSFKLPNPPENSAKMAKAKSFHHHNHNYNYKAFSGPIVSIIPEEARRKKKTNATFEYSPDDPTSPKVSCIGQIKHKNKTNPKRLPPLPPPPAVDDGGGRKQKRLAFAIRRMFTRKVRPGRRSDDDGHDEEGTTAATRPPPSLGMMKRFTSGRETLADFDWRKAENDDDDDEVIIPHSAPILMGGGGAVAMEPKKEVNLWKRRTLDPPMPLQMS